MKSLISNQHKICVVIRAQRLGIIFHTLRAVQRNMSEHWIDGAWKEVLKGDLDDAISFFMPSLAAERDYSKIPEAADPVHPVIGGKSDKGSNISDVCFKVPLKNGSFPRTLFLVEQQHEEDKSLPLHVFQSWYRASDEYQFPVTALVIYTGGAKPLNTYYREWHGTSVNFMFNTYSVPDDANVEELKRDSENEEKGFNIVRARNFPVFIDAIIYLDNASRIEQFPACYL